MKLRDLNTGFVVRGVILALPVAIALIFVASLARIAGPPPDPTPVAPTILAPRGGPPAGPVGLRAWARYRDESYNVVGSGFLLQLSDGQLVGVTAAHSVAIGNPDRPLEQIALGFADQAEFVAELDAFHGRPGQPRTGSDMAVDYVLLKTHQSLDTNMVLTPDPRGGPQPGERVSLFTDMGSASGGQRVLEGTVQSASDKAVWVLMDRLFNPAMMSGSPFVSQHTGQAVGMLIAGTLRGRRLLLAVHPIGSIVALAESAEEFPRMAEYGR